MLDKQGKRKCPQGIYDRHVNNTGFCSFTAPLQRRAPAKSFLVGEEGLEPSRANAHKILSLACIPISPLARPKTICKPSGLRSTNSTTAAQDIKERLPISPLARKNCILGITEAIIIRTGKCNKCACIFAGEAHRIISVRYSIITG